MNDKINEILEGIAAETFEGLAFLFGFPEEVENAPQSESMMVKVGFQGSFSGQLVMAVTRQTVQELTANMLGLDDGEENISPDDLADALKETINVICGNLLPAIGGKDAVFDIRQPETLSDASFLETIPGATLVSVAKLSIDDEPCQLSLFVEGQHAEAIMNLKD
jgi:CheY-specific phosphatase CheX